MEESVGRRKRVTVALCGFGRAGRIHFNSIRQNHRCHLKYIVDVFGNSDVLKFARDKLQEYYLLDTVALVEASDFESIVLADATVDAVVITVPTPLHESYVRSSLTAKKAVFCEKPLAFDVKDAASFYDLAAQNESPLFCSFQRRFDRGMVKLKRQVADGNVGQVYHLKTTSRDSPRPTIDYMKSSGHIFHDTAVHDLDYICWVIGEDPVEVFAQGSTFDPEIRAIGDFDTILISLKFPSGALATTDISRHSTYGYDMRIEVYIIHV